MFYWLKLLVMLPIAVVVTLVLSVMLWFAGSEMEETDREIE